MRTPALEHLLGAYFHQDWADDGTEQEVLETFVDDEPDLATSLPQEIEHVLSSHPNEEDLARVLFEKGSYYVPPVDQGGYRGWLLRIAERAARH